ncbi:MAG TPA: hypothetical protein VMG08_09935 [Allosphingosinicella sp.]|nr:hypothetical protein [Allosphingosinicella sp.]
MSDKTDELGLASRLIIGGIAGFVATLAMTSALRRRHGKAAPEVDAGAAPRPPASTPELKLAMHFVIGAGCGAMLAAADPRLGRVNGALAGGGLWLASSMGWLPAFGPARPGIGQLGAHLAWGWSAAKGMRELAKARTALAG